MAGQGKAGQERHVNLSGWVEALEIAGKAAAARWGLLYENDCHYQ